MAVPAAAAAIAAGCGAGSHETAPTTTPLEPIVCEQIMPVDWQPFPPNIKPGYFARVLGVTVDQVEAGSSGPARCQEPIDTSQVYSETVQVKGQPNSECLVIDVLDAKNLQPVKDGASTIIGVLCVSTEVSS